MRRAKTSAAAVFPPAPPQPAPGCTQCTQLDRQRNQARTSGDHSRVSDCNVLISLHPHDSNPGAGLRGQR